MFDNVNINRLKGRCNRGELPDFVCDYLKAFKQKASPRSKWADLRMVVFDTETTGLNIQNDRILEIGAVAIRNGEIWIKDSFELLVSAERKPGMESISVHGLLPGEVRMGGEDELEAIKKLLNYIQADVLIAHHIYFDVSMVEMVLRRLGMEKFFLFNPKIDTAFMAQKLDQASRRNYPQEASNYGLDELCKRYNISMEDRHRAWGDAMITAKLFLKLSHEFYLREKNLLKHITV
ncbi:MAG: 3'-5' exonuclease [Bacteroidia bacterium]|nr:3'-5' exonuclease [Bacteroidia bacterium]